LIVACRLTPKGGRDAIEGAKVLSDGTVVLACRVREPPEDGRANAALCRLIAGAAGVPASRARIVAGARSRLKQVLVEGDAETLAPRLTPTT
jgi:uncharacterized protein YggU (UPF0235/DUF167 family)